MTNNLTTSELLKRSLDTFLAKDMKGWADLCDGNVVVEFPFAPDASSKKFVGRTAIYSICATIQTSLM